MKNIHWAAFWIGLFGLLTAWIISAYNAKPDISPNADQAIISKCAQNNGIVIRDNWGTITDCKIYKK